MPATAPENTTERKSILSAGSPLIVTLAAGVLALFGTVFNGWQSWRVEQIKQEKNSELEERKRKGDLILQAIKTDQRENAAANLIFLAETKLLTLSEDQIAVLKKYAPKEIVPVLPSSKPPSSALPSSVLPASLAPHGDTLALRVISLTMTLEGTALTRIDYDQSEGLSFGLLGWTTMNGQLQQLLRGCRETDAATFEKIFGSDLAAIEQMINGDSTSASMAIQSMVDQNGLKAAWKKHFEDLGKEPKFQQIQVNAAVPFVEKAREMAAELDFHSERGVAFFFDLIVQSGNLSQRSTEAYNRSLANLTKAINRPPDEVEKLVLLAVVTSDSTTPRFRNRIKERRLMIAKGQGQFAGQAYELDKFALGLRDAKTGQPIKAFNDTAILARIESGEF